jgi:ADP-heptose:LPS heptosyltransferase
VLFIGNDSGPKHIAAAVGIPTVGIHSGVVDPVDWGPIGPSSVALRRNMVCGPCYLANAEDCPRSPACLCFFEPNMVDETADLMLKRPRPLFEAISGSEPVGGDDGLDTDPVLADVGPQQYATESV